MKALILAAGQGTRLGELTAARPKPMLPVGGRPLLEYTLRWLRDFGIAEVAINLHHLPERIREHFGGGASFELAITYSLERELMGTAGAAKRLEAFLDEPFVVVYGDVLTNLDLWRLRRLHMEDSVRLGASSVATLALYSVHNPTECGLIELDATRRVTSFVEKPRPEDVRTDLAFSGVMICDPVILQYIPDGRPADFGFDVFPTLLEQGLPMYGESLVDGEYVIDIGTPAGYERALAMVCDRTTRQ